VKSINRLLKGKALLALVVSGALIGGAATAASGAGAAAAGTFPSGAGPGWPETISPVTSSAR
jgi:hypothetical protein